MEIFIVFSLIVFFLGFVIKFCSKESSNINDNMNITTTSEFYKRERSGRN